MAQHTIIVFGGAGRTGKEFVLQALKSGHMVSAFVYRTPTEGSMPNHQNLRIIEGNARDASSVEAALIGHDVVVNIIAPKLTDTKNYDISEVATTNIIAGMQKLGITRYIGQSGAWATDQLSDASLPMRIGFKIVPMFRGIYGYKKREDALVKNSGLNWTIVRCGLLTDKPKRDKIRIFRDRYKCGLLEIPKISRKNVAGFELSILDDQSYWQTCPIIIN